MKFHGHHKRDIVHCYVNVWLFV